MSNLSNYTIVLYIVFMLFYNLMGVFI